MTAFLTRLVLAFAAVLALGASPAHAASDGVALQSDVMLQKTVEENGRSRTVLTEPKAVVPGDRLLFTTRYTNAGPPVQNFVVTNPLPSAVVYVPVAGGTEMVSVDGGQSWGRLSALTRPDGKGGVRAAVPGDVTHVRWTIASIAAGASGKLEYHAIVR